MMEKKSRFSLDLMSPFSVDGITFDNGELHTTIRIKRNLVPENCLLAFTFHVENSQTVELYLNAKRLIRWNIQGSNRVIHAIPVPNSKTDDNAVTFSYSKSIARFSSLKIVKRIEDICHVPFSKIDLRKDFVPCCSEWLTEQYYEIERSPDTWNGRQAQELRKSIYRGDYSFCNLDRCIKKRSKPEELKNFKVIPPENLKAIEKKLPEMPAIPRTVVLHADPRCNLSCESCRPSKITAVTEEEKARIGWEKRWLETHRQDIRRLFLASDGEVFFSPYLRKTLKDVSLDLYPNLEFVQINSNGLLFNEKAMNDLKPGTDFIKEVQVSVDAGNAETYKRVRGGDWKRLLQNLRWMAEQRAKGRFRRFQLNFVIRKANYLSIPDFVNLGTELGADTLHMTDFRNWRRSKFQNYNDELVNLPHHPEFSSYRDIIQSSRNLRVRLNRSVDPLQMNIPNLMEGSAGNRAVVDI